MARRAWSDAEVARLVAFVRWGERRGVIAREFDRSLASIRHKIAELRAAGRLPPGVATHPRGPATDRYADGLFERLWRCLTISVDEIAAHYGVTRQAVCQAARVRKLPSRRRNRANRLIRDDALFRELWLAGVRRKDIARRFGCGHVSTVNNRVRALDLPPRKARGGGKGAKGGWPTVPIEAFPEARVGMLMRGQL